MPYTTEGTEYVVIDGVPLDTPAWRTLNLDALWGGATLRGQDRIMPGATGVRVKRRRVTTTTVNLNLEIFGDFDWQGNPQSDARVGLEVNIEHLWENVAEPPVTSPYTRTVQLYMPSGLIRTGEAHVESFTIQGDSPTTARAVLELSLTGGLLQGVNWS